MSGNSNLHLCFSSPQAMGRFCDSGRGDYGGGCHSSFSNPCFYQQDLGREGEGGGGGMHGKQS